MELSRKYQKQKKSNQYDEKQLDSRTIDNISRTSGNQSFKANSIKNMGCIRIKHNIDTPIMISENNQVSNTKVDTSK